MVITKMSKQECRDLLARLGFGRLATSHKRQPYVVPIYFAYEGGRLYGFTTLGRKVQWMRANPRVCVEVDEVADQLTWSSVVVLGKYEELPDTAKHKRLRLRAEALLGKRARWSRTAHASNQLRGPRRRSNALFYCIHVNEITGRKAAKDPAEWGGSDEYGGEA